MFVGGPNIRKDYHIQEGEEVGLRTALLLTQPWGRGHFPCQDQGLWIGDGVVRWLKGEEGSTKITG